MRHYDIPLLMFFNFFLIKRTVILRIDPMPTEVHGKNPISFLEE